METQECGHYHACFHFRHIINIWCSCTPTKLYCVLWRTSINVVSFLIDCLTLSQFSPAEIRIIATTISPTCSTSAPNLLPYLLTNVSSSHFLMHNAEKKILRASMFYLWIPKMIEFYNRVYFHLICLMLFHSYIVLCSPIFDFELPELPPIVLVLRYPSALSSFQRLLFDLIASPWEFSLVSDFDVMTCEVPQPTASLYYTGVAFHLSALPSFLVPMTREQDAHSPVQCQLLQCHSCSHLFSSKTMINQI